MNVLRSVAAAATKTKNEHDIFGEYGGSKLKMNMIFSGGTVARN